MSRPYLIEVRTGGRVKQQLREIMYDVADEFGVRGAVDPRPVPHITLFGPYDTNCGREVKKTLLSSLSDFDVVPYRVDGFGAFPENSVVYANVVPSPALRELRREISRQVRPLASGYPSYDDDFFYDFHITIAFRDVGEQLDDILDYLRQRYELRFDEYATRVTSLRHRNMLWEYDLLCNNKYREGSATSRETWRQTERSLKQKATESDHDQLQPTPGQLARTVHSVFAKITRRW